MAHMSEMNSVLRDTLTYRLRELRSYLMAFNQINSQQFNELRDHFEAVLNNVCAAFNIAVPKEEVGPTSTTPEILRLLLKQLSEIIVANPGLKFLPVYQRAHLDALWFAMNSILLYLTEQT